MLNKSVLDFRGYSVKELKYEMLESSPQTQFSLEPVFTKDISQLENDEFQATISFEIKPSEKNPSPFNLKVILVGDFAFNTKGECDLDGEAKRHIMNHNAFSILFPFLRAIVANLTTTANMPSLMLPVMDFSEGEEAAKNSEKNKE